MWYLIASIPNLCTLIYFYNSEVLSILTELSCKHTKFSDKLEQLSSRVDSIYNGSNECDYGDNQSENSYMNIMIRTMRIMHLVVI